MVKIEFVKSYGVSEERNLRANDRALGNKGCETGGNANL